MSVESAKAFLKKAGEDKDLQEKVKGADSEEKFFAVVKAASCPKKRGIGVVG
jgi:predicted ribosomally synthesized peptide with nif11-like leader